MPIADILAKFAKLRPPGKKTSDCLKRFAPALSTRLINGSLFSFMISAPRSALTTPISVMLPPLIPESEALTMHLTPDTYPIPLIPPPPEIFLSPSSSPILYPARVERGMK